MIKITTKDIGKVINVTLNSEKKEIIYKGNLIEFTDEIIKLKLIDNGYNIGILQKDIKKIEILDEKVSLGKITSKKTKENKDLPNIVYIGTGGTIGTHVDYVTGAVTMCRTPEEIISTTPEIENIINIKKIESPFIKASEDIYYKDWQKLSEIVYKYLIDDTIDGIIITHGTDTLSFTGSALSFMIENINKPVLLVGAQRSPDRASFDGSQNLICASIFIKEKIPGVFTVMHGSINDDYCEVINSVKSRKMHTSRRDAFKAINSQAICKVYLDGKIKYNLDKENLKNKNKKPILNNFFEEKTALIKLYPNSDPSIIDWYIEKGYKGIILEGTGLGHVPTGQEDKEKLPAEYQWVLHIKKATEKGIVVILSSQCLFGRVNGKVYANLRYIANAGGEYLDSHDMLPEVALIKLGIALKKFNKREDIINYMKKNISGEITDKEVPEYYEESI